MKSLANLLSTIIPEHCEAIKNALYARGYTKKEVCRTDLTALVRQDGRLLLSVLLDETCKQAAIVKSQKEAIYRVIQQILTANHDKAMVPANIIWIGPPRKDGDDTFAAKSLAIDMPKQPINFWVLDQYAHYYQAIFNDYPNVRIIPVLNYVKKINLVFSDKKTILDDFKFYLKNPVLFGSPARLYVTLVDYVKIIYQWHEGGYVLDANVLIHPSNSKGQPITHLPIPMNLLSNLQHVELLTKPNAINGQPEIWLMYSPDELCLPLSLHGREQMRYNTMDSVKCLEIYRHTIAKKIEYIQTIGKSLSCTSINKFFSGSLVAPASRQERGKYLCKVKQFTEIGLIENEGFTSGTIIKIEPSAFSYSENNTLLNVVKYYENSHLSLTPANRAAFKDNLRYHLSAIASLWIFQKYMTFSSIAHIDNLTYITKTCLIALSKGEYPNGLTPDKWIKANEDNVTRHKINNGVESHEYLSLIRKIPVMHCTIMHEVILYGNAEKLDLLISILSKRDPATLEKMFAIETLVIEAGVQQSFTPVALAEYLNRTGCLNVLERHGYTNTLPNSPRPGNT